MSLKNINLEVERGALVGIVGKIGSGKSSLLQALVGELEAKEGSRVDIRGKVAYVAQKSWSQSTSLEENIVFYGPERSVWESI